MNQSASVTVHRSCFPDQVEADLVRSFQHRQIAPKFLYDSFQLSQKWHTLALRYAPYFHDPTCRRAYRRAFKQTARALAETEGLQVVSLGCGSGEKDRDLLRLLSGSRVRGYLPCDVSLALVLRARQSAKPFIEDEQCLPIVSDLTAPDFGRWLNRFLGPQPRLITCFGIIPNLEPTRAIALLRRLVRPEDYLLLSVNLAPQTPGIRQVRPRPKFSSGPPVITPRDARPPPSYPSETPAALIDVLAQYDNDLTRDWLWTFLSDRGIDETHGHLSFTLEPGALARPARITADFRFARPARMWAGHRRFRFRRGERLRLFFSCRYTIDQVRHLLAAARLRPLEQWFTDREDEGVFLVRRL